MRSKLFEPGAPKRTVSVTLNSDLYAKAKAAGLNASRVAEEALAQAYADTCARALAEELRQDLEAANRYVEQHGSFAEMVRAHYEGDDGAV
jgi:antitoxin CcdA